MTDQRIAQRQLRRLRSLTGLRTALAMAVALGVQGREALVQPLQLFQRALISAARAVEPGARTLQLGAHFTVITLEPEPAQVRLIKPRLQRAQLGAQLTMFAVRVLNLRLRGFAALFSGHHL